MNLEAAIKFATESHAGQTRRTAAGMPALPYIVHPLDVMTRLIRAGVADRTILSAAVLHDVIEDCGVTRDELAGLFGPAVADVVVEVSDPAGLSKTAAKKRQVEIAPLLSLPAKLVKLADKAANVADLVAHPPDWKPESIVGYSHGAYDVVQALGLDAARHVEGNGPIINRLLNDFYNAFQEIKR